MKLTGVFVYSNKNNVYTYVNSVVTGVYNASGENCEINLVQDGKYTDLVENNTYVCTNGRLILPYKDINAFLLVKEE